MASPMDFQKVPLCLCFVRVVYWGIGREGEVSLHGADFHFCHFAPFVAFYPVDGFCGEEGEGV